MRIDNGRYREVVMDWSNITLPLKAGTPISAAGEVANTASAIGLNPDKVIEQTPMPRSIFILDAGDVDLAEVETLSGLTLTDACKHALDGIRFHKADGTVEDNVLPASTTTDEGKVLTVGSDGKPEWANASGGGYDIDLLINKAPNRDTVTVSDIEIISGSLAEMEEKMAAGNPVSGRLTFLYPHVDGTNTLDCNFAYHLDFVDFPYNMLGFYGYYADCNVVEITFDSNYDFSSVVID